MLRARNDEAMRATMQYCGSRTTPSSSVSEITEAVPSDAGLLVVCAGLAWSGSTPSSRNYLFNLHDVRGLAKLRSPDGVHVRPAQ